MDKKKILIVDDIEINRLVISELFRDHFDILEAQNGVVALEHINKYGTEIVVVLLDLVMPILDGFGVLREMNRLGVIQSIPVIMLTSENDDYNVILGYELGVSDLMHKPFNPEIIYKRVNNVIDLYSYKNFLEQKLKEQKEELEKQQQRIRQSNLFLIDALSTTVEFRNFESGEHIKRMRTLVKLLLEECSEFCCLSDSEIESISNASVLHDIGKIAIPDSVLLKPGPLTKEEFEIMKTHTLRGCEILESLNYFEDRQYYKYCYDICRSHHERWDGKGYPDGLVGSEIPVWAQAASLADVYDALTSKRVYKDAYSHEEAAAMIMRGECGTFNPHMLDCFKKIEPKLISMINPQGKNLQPN